MAPARASTIGCVPFRQIFTVLLALIAILLAALLVLSWDGDDGDSVSPSGTTLPPDDDATTTTSTPATTTLAPVTTSIPVDCGTDPETGESTTTSAPADTTTTLGEDAEPEPDAATGPTLGRNSSLSTVGLDTVTFGLTVNQAERASGHDLIACDAVTDCYRVTPDGAPTGISFVVDEGTIERVDIVGDSPITTLSGAGIGSTDDELDDLFGDRLERVDLGGGRTDVVFVPADENDQDFRVVFTTLDGEVESLRSGRVPLVLETVACA
jgi:hypothetical protein